MAVLICITIGGLGAVIALSLKPYMEIVMIEKSIASLWYIPLAIVALIFIQGGLKYLFLYLSTRTGGKITNVLKYNMVKKLMTLPTPFFDKRNSGWGKIPDSKFNLPYIFERIELVFYNTKYH